MRPWIVPALANILLVWQPQPLKNGGSLRQKIRALGTGYCGSSSLATAPPDTLPRLGPSRAGRFSALIMKIGQQQIVLLSMLDSHRKPTAFSHRNWSNPVIVTPDGKKGPTNFRILKAQSAGCGRPLSGGLVMLSKLRHAATLVDSIVQGAPFS